MFSVSIQSASCRCVARSVVAAIVAETFWDTPTRSASSVSNGECCSSAKVEEAAALLRRKDAMAFTTVVAAPEDASLGERYATIATAAALGERVRDQGGHALVVIDDLACMVSTQLAG